MLINWHNVKSRLRDKKTFASFEERDIYWCSVGLNIGFEVFGKGNLFTRPVLVLKKFNTQLFLGAPLSSIQKDNKYYYNFLYENKKQAVLISQIRVFSAARLYQKIGKMEKKEFTKVKSLIKEKLL